MAPKKQDHPFVIFQNAFPASVIGMMVLQVAVINIVLVLGGVFLGIYLDRQLGSKPAFTVGLGLLGAIVAGVLTFISAMRTVKRARVAYLNYAATGEDTDKKAAVADTIHIEAAQKASMV